MATWERSNNPDPVNILHSTEYQKHLATDAFKVSNQKRNSLYIELILIARKIWAILIRQLLPPRVKLAKAAAALPVDFINLHYDKSQALCIWFWNEPYSQSNMFSYDWDWPSYWCKLILMRVWFQHMYMESTIMRLAHKMLRSCYFGVLQILIISFQAFLSVNHHVLL